MGKLIEKMKNARSKATSALTVAGVSATTAIATMAPALAEDNKYFGNFFTKISGAADGLFDGIQSIVGPIGGAAAAYCLVMMVMTKDQKKLEGYKQWLISILICIVLIYAFPAVIKIAQGFGETISNG